MMVPSFDLFVVCWFVCLLASLPLAVVIVVVVVIVVILVTEKFIWTLESVKKYQEAGKNHIMKSFIICFPH